MSPNSDREQLERIYRTSPSGTLRFQLRQFLQAIQWMIRESLHNPKVEPRIRKYFDIEGHPIWHIYDPVSQQSLTSKSELEVAAWLEEQYAHRS